MRWNDYVAVVERADGQTTKPFVVRAVSVKHAMNKVERMFSTVTLTRWEVELCRCSEINNDMCSAHYLYWSGQ